MIENLLSQCINDCEKCIDACQKLVDFCGVPDGAACAQQLGIINARSTKCMETCKEIVTHTEKLLKQTDDHEIIKRGNWLIKKAQHCIDSCHKIIKECHADRQKCVNECVANISHCQACAQACQEMADALKAES